MRRPLTLLTISTIAAGCAGHSASPASSAPAAGPAAAARREAPTLRYAAGTSRYHTLTEVSQDVMGQAQTFDTHTFLSAVASSAGANLGFAITIDSMTTNAPGAEGLAGVRGHVVNVVVSPSGQPVSITIADSTNPAMLQASEGLRELLPQLPEGPIAAGSTWTDTVTRHVPAPDADLTLTVTRQHRVVGWEEHDGVRALHIATTGTYTMTGTGSAQGQSLEFTGAGRNGAEHFVSAAGVYLGGTSADTADVNVNVVSAGMQVQVHRTQRSTVTRLP